jgi:hypothetical protein
LAAAVLVVFIDRSPRRLFTFAASFVAAACACLVPVWLSGGWAKFLDYGFLSKGSYLTAGSLPYWGSFREAIPDARLVSGTYFVADWISATIFLLPFTLPMLIITWRRDPVTSAALFMFSIVGLMSAYPRVHMHLAAPLLLLSIVYVASQCEIRRWLPLIGLVFCFALAVLLRGPASILWKGSSERMHVSHFHFMPLFPDKHASLESMATKLRGHTEKNGPVFLLFARASVYYLLTGAQNPTQFDYPIVTTLGRTGITNIEHRIDNGTLPNVCVAEDYSPRLNATELIQYVKTHMTIAEDLGECQMYRSPAGNPLEPKITYLK